MRELKASYNKGNASTHSRGGMCERLKQAVLKTALLERVTGVRIPLPPPLLTTYISINYSEVDPASLARSHHGAERCTLPKPEYHLRRLPLVPFTPCCRGGGTIPITHTSTALTVCCKSPYPQRSAPATDDYRSLTQAADARAQFMFDPDRDADHLRC